MRLEQVEPLVQCVEGFPAGVRIVLGRKVGKVVEVVIGKSALKRHRATFGEVHVLIHPAIFNVRFAATPDAQMAADAYDPRGLTPGTHVTVSADDYGRDAVEGTILFGNAHEIAIARSDDQVGDVVVHFPRAGFMVTKI